MFNLNINNVKSDLVSFLKDYRLIILIVIVSLT